jgi:hypothetical protein
MMDVPPVTLEWDDNVPMEPHVEQLMFESRDDELDNEVPQEEIEAETEEKVPEWWLENIGAMTIPLMQEAFIKCQPRDSSKYLYTSDLAKEDAEPEGSEKKTEDSRGMPDALYALYYEWECKKEIFGKSYRHSPEFKQRICGLKGGDVQPDDPKVMNWMNKKKAKFGCQLQTVITNSGAAFSYLEKSGKPLLSNGMLRPMLEACHQATGCRAAKYLRREFLSKFCVGKWSTKLVKEAAKDLKCSICDGSRPLPKKQHVESIFTYAPLRRMQMDATQIASEKLKRFRGSHKYRYLLTLVDCFTKYGWVWPLKTLSIAETLVILKKFFAEQFIPDILQSDNGPQFKNDLLAAVCQELHIQQRFGASETPQHQGQIERYNKTFKINLFRWVKQMEESVACETWHSTGLAYVLAQYRRNIHSTTNMSPDMLMFGTMRTPEDRKACKGLTKSLLALVDDPESNALTSTMRDYYEDTLAKCVWAYLELRETNVRKAMNSTERTQLANRLKRSGIRISKSILPKVGNQVLMRRPVKRPNTHVGKDPMQSVNVSGVVLAVRLASASFQVQWTDERTKQTHSVWTGAHGLVFSEDVCLTPQPRTLTTSDIAIHMKDFINEIGVWWRDTKASLTEVRENKEEVCEYDVREALNELGLGEWEHQMTDQQFAEQILLAVLDEKFVRYLRDCEPGLESIQGKISDEDTVTLINYTIKNLGYKELLAAAGVWRKDRVSKPALLYPKVLQALSGIPHVCASCVHTEHCHPEHACCREFLLSKLHKMGWHRGDHGIEVLLFCWSDEIPSLGANGGGKRRTCC